MTRSRLKSEKVNIRLTPSEKRIILGAAAEESRTISSWIRKVCVEVAKKQLRNEGR